MLVVTAVLAVKRACSIGPREILRLAKLIPVLEAAFLKKQHLSTLSGEVMGGVGLMKEKMFAVELLSMRQRVRFEHALQSV